MGHSEDVVGASLKQIAEMLGVSQATVSLVLREKPVRCSKETAEKIRAAAKQYNYKPNFAAVTLATNKSRIIGVLVPDIENMFFSRLIKKLGKKISEAGYMMLLFDTNNNIDDEKKYIEYLSNKNADGMILALLFDGTSEQQEGLVKAVNDLDVAHVVIDTTSPLLKCPKVEVDHYKGAYLATEFLIRNGHKKIACVKGPKENYSTKERLRAYRDALENNGLPFLEERVFCGDNTYDSGKALAEKVFASDVTAVFCSNDMMAYGVLNAAGEAGVKVPEDLSVVGFDDVEFFAQGTSLTTVRQPIEGIAEFVADNLFGGMESGTWEKGREIIKKVEPQLIVRGSVCVRRGD